MSLLYEASLASTLILWRLSLGEAGDEEMRGEFMRGEWEGSE